MRISDWSSDVCSSDLVLAGEVGGGGEDALFVLQIAFGHHDRAGGGGVRSGAGLQERDDLATAGAGALDDGIDLRLGRPAQLDEVGNGDAADGRVGGDRDHRVAMAAKHEGGDVLDRDVELLGEEVAEARGIEHAGHASPRSEEHTSELQSLMRTSYAVFCLNTNKTAITTSNDKTQYDR